METRPWRLVDVVLLLIVLTAAGGARAWYLIDQADGATKNGPLEVQDDRARELKEVVGNLRSGKGFVSHSPLADHAEVTAHMSPGYAWMVAAVGDLTEDWADNPDVVVRWLQCGLGTLTAGFYFLFARRAFQSLLAAMLAGLLCALHPFWVNNTAEINDGVLAAFLLAAAIFSGTRAGQLGGPTASLLFGLSLAGLALVRAPLLPFGVVAMVWFLARCRSVKRGWLCALLALLGFINGLVPWTLRNVQRFGDIVPIVDSAYWHLWIGNRPGANGGPGEASNEGEGSGKSILPAELADLPKTQNQKERFNELGPRVLDSIQEDPAGTVRRRLMAGLAFVFGAEWFTGQHRLCHGDADYAGVLYGSLLGMLLLAGLGWRWSYGWRHSSMLLALAVIWIPLPYLLSHAEMLSGPRLPLDGVLLCYAGFALAGIITWCIPRGRALLDGPADESE